MSDPLQDVHDALDQAEQNAIDRACRELYGLDSRFSGLVVRDDHRVEPVSVDMGIEEKTDGK